MMKRALLATIVVTVGYGVLLLGSAVWARAEAPHALCSVRESVVQVDTAAHILSLCHAGKKEVERFATA